MLFVCGDILAGRLLAPNREELIKVSLILEFLNLKFNSDNILSYNLSSDNILSFSSLAKEHLGGISKKVSQRI